MSKFKELAELREYGIGRVYDSSEYPLDDYHPLKFILHYLNDRAYLPKLEALLQTCRNQDNDGTWEALRELGALPSKNSRGQTPGTLRDILDANDAW